MRPMIHFSVFKRLTALSKMSRGATFNRLTALSLRTEAFDEGHVISEVAEKQKKKAARRVRTT